jgi:hypothetical protein
MPFVPSEGVTAGVGAGVDVGVGVIEAGVSRPSLWYDSICGARR